MDERKESILKVTSTSKSVIIESGSPAETEAAAAALADLLGEGACVALYGDLGSGKTVFARGLLRGLGVGSEVPVTSPTFVIISEYEGRVAVHHIDAYRLRDAGDIVALGSRELFYNEAVSVVEWADRIEDALPEERFNVLLSITGAEGRRLSVSASGAACRALLESFGRALAEP